MQATNRGVGIREHEYGGQVHDLPFRRHLRGNDITKMVLLPTGLLLSQYGKWSMVLLKWPPCPSKEPRLYPSYSQNRLTNISRSRSRSRIPAFIALDQKTMHRSHHNHKTTANHNSLWMTLLYLVQVLRYDAQWRQPSIVLKQTVQMESYKLEDTTFQKSQHTRIEES